MKVRNELEAEKMQQVQWELAITQLKHNREVMMQQHEENMARIRDMTPEPAHSDQAVTWLKTQLGEPTQPPREDTSSKSNNTQKEFLLEQLHKQQEEIQRQIQDISTGEKESSDAMGKLKAALSGQSKDRTEQELLLEQLRAALAPKEAATDPNKALLKALITSQNKTTGTSGINTLCADILKKITGEGEFSMAEWLASLNKQEEGECEINKLYGRCEDDSDCRSECRHSKMKSGMLDKSTTNIRHKEVWPQKNLGEDWAEEEIEFKQLKFEHLVAGETRTIETCDDPAQILGRLRLLRCIAYLKLRGIEWHLLRKMYAAILSSIETREYSWESNFDRFESILYCKYLTDRNTDRDQKPQEGRKRFCRDFNKPEGCPRTSPHTAWFGNGPMATKRTVHHCCAACLIRDKVAREHPEGHRECPHRA